MFRTHHKLDLFITITYNPKWPEMNNNLFLRQEPQHRPGQVARVLILEKDQLIKLRKGRVFGQCVAIEFQNRGIPHIHCMFNELN